MSLCLPSLRRVNYDVFLSFRGPDTRKNIISHLYKELVRQGIRTFKDDRTLEIGDCFPSRLCEAIHTSRFAIVVISENYGISSWSLEELRLIMELELDNVIPIFYNVNISDVRDHKGKFSLEDHNQSRQIPKWKEALKRIAEKQGFVSTRCKDDATVVEGVVELVSDKLMSILPMDLGDIVGMEAQIYQIEHLLDMAFTTKEVRMVGIWGMVGVGKTAIAKNLYEKHKHHFKNHHCFMERVSSLKKKGPLFLQKQLLSNILRKRDLEALNLGQGAPCIKSRLVNLKSLIVIDDVDDVKQLDALAKEASWFGPGSRIIITTRDKSLLNSSCPVYKVECFNEDKALQIFQRIAFQGAEPPIAYKDLCIRISQLAQGLPSVLEDFGTYLRGKSVLEWRDALKSFQEALPEKTIVDLKSSYDGLDERGKTAFLHVACIFNGEPVRRVRKLLGQGKAGMRVLKEKSLIKVSADRRISMHRLLEKMGKQVVRQESGNSPSQQRVLWHHHDIRQVLATKTGTHLIEGVSLDVCELPAVVHINWDVFKPMCNLKFLKIYNSKQTGGLQPWWESIILEENLSVHKLRLLHWDAYPFTTLPTSITPDCLVELKLCYSKLKTLWSGTPKLVNLMKLDLTGSKDLTKLPNLKEAKCLEELILEGCSSLKRIPNSVGKLSRLQKLDLSNCDGLKELKISISDSNDIGGFEDTIMCLRSVRMFFFGTESFVGNNTQGGCSLTDPSIRGNLQIYLKLLEGNADHLSFVSENHVCHELKLKSPPYGFKSLDIMRFDWTDKSGYFNCGSFSRFPWLQELNLINLNIEKIPDDIDQMQVLEKLDLSGNMFKRLPTTMRRLTKLKHLTLANCRSLEELPGLSQVEILTLSDCINLRTLVKQNQGSYSLLELWLDNCKKIKSLPNELKHFTELTYLDLSRHDFKTISSEMLGGLTSLVTLRLNYCNNLEEMTMVPLSLKCLTTHGCKSLRAISFLATHSVDHRDRSPCPEWKDYSTFARFPAGRRSKEYVHVLASGKQHHLVRINMRIVVAYQSS
ncbi:hypothetical protein Bca52824_012990 [Brassica carinata]|uniref:TIR domain-containing protein n=1 Tax=Brassica carinata TaxID=52824 RepID=A0A8X8B2Z0_BRACI|nr:hypothetical protein Bca52824_012990 [Brassica carinata]